MDLLVRRSGGHNIVGRPQARPRWYPDATAPAAVVHVYKHDADKGVATALKVGEYAPGSEFSMDFNPVRDRNIVLRLVPYSASGTPRVSHLRDAEAVSVLFERDTVAVAGIDEHVPTVTLPPDIAKSSQTSEQWTVFTPAPDDDAATVKYGHLRVRKADDLSVEYVYNIAVQGFHYIHQEPFDCVIDYQWLGQSSEDIGNGRGWSEWSPTAAAAGSDAAVQPAPAGEVIQTTVFDANDSMAAVVRDIVE